MASTNPQEITVKGRISFPVFTYDQAVARDAKSKFPKKDKNDIRPGFDLLLTQTMLEKLTTHLRDVFLPWCIEQEKLGDKGKSKLTAAQAKKITKIIDEGDYEVDQVVGLIRAVHETTAELAPEAVATLKVNGMKGRDLNLKAVVKSTDDLNPLDDRNDDIILPPRGEIMDLDRTKLEIYPGAYVAATINLFAFTGANVGITASTGSVIFLDHRDRFGGGGETIDEDDIFLDDDED